MFYSCTSRRACIVQEPRYCIFWPSAALKLVCVCVSVFGRLRNHILLNENRLPFTRQDMRLVMKYCDNAGSDYRLCLLSYGEYVMQVAIM